jgi:SecD/SecF fusion protein
MSKSIWKWLILIGMTAWSLAIVTPVKEKVKLGIDLKGGSSFTVEIDQERVKENILEEEPEISEAVLANRIKSDSAEAQENAVEVIRNRVDGLGIAEPNIYATTAGDNYRIIVQLPGIDDAQREAARESIESVAFLEFRMVHKDNDEWIGDLFQKAAAPRGFKISETGAAYVPDYTAVPVEQRGLGFYESMKKFQYRPGTEFLLEKNEDNQGRVTYRLYYVEARRHLTGESVADAQVQYHPVTRKPAVSIRFDSEGRKRFAVITRNFAPRGPKNPNSDIGRQLAIILDGTLYSAPTINEEIPSGSAEISGSFSMTEALRLSNVLRAGSLKAPVQIVEVRSVSPSLGQDSVESGLRALSYGGIAVLGFMLCYYLLCGVIANIALILNILLLPFGMVIAAGFLGTLTNATATAGSAASLPTLTLPGIAGIVLTIGMAVDANVLIFERIREEQLAGKHFGNAITAGYDKVFSTIVDANITTLLTAVILFWQGSGPIRGFAVTLTAGIIVSVFTALVVTRMFFDLLGSKKEFRTLKMLTLVKKSNIDFLGKRGIAAALSVVLIAGTWVMFFQRGVDSNFGVDFTGGASVAFTFEDKVPVEDVRTALEAAGVTEPVIQYQKDLGKELVGGVNEFLEVKVAFEDTEAVKSSIPKAFTDNYQFQKEDSVGPQS